MGKATIIEAQNSNAVYEEGKTKGILGKLKGVFADYKHGTRNSDRLYTEELWDNRVFGSEDVMEALETKTLFGELDHPEGDRCETLAKNAAITITKLEKKPEEGVIYGEAEILDTPTGRILKALADSGAKLGISSRGMGEEIFREGQNIIDPETYDFITFDVVVTPANTKARVSLTESKQLNKLKENIQKEIEESETVNQLNQVKTVLENVNLDKKEELVNLVETKLAKLSAVNKVPNNLTEANKQIALNLLKKKCEESTQCINELKESADKLSELNNTLKEENTFYKESRDTLKAKLKEAKESEYKLKNEVTIKMKELEKVNTQLEEAKKLNERINKEAETKKIEETIIKMKQVNTKKVENLEAIHKEELAKQEAEIAKLQKENTEKEEQINTLVEENNKLKENLDASSKILSENKQLQEQIDKMKQSSELHNKKLNESKILSENKVKQLELKIAELEKENSKRKDLEERFSKLSFSPLGTVKAMTENFRQEDYSDEEVQLFNALTGK